LSLGDSSSYNSTDKTNHTNIHTQYKKDSTNKTKQYIHLYIKVHILSSNRNEATQLEADPTPHPINMIKILWNISHPHIKPLRELVLAPCIHLTSTILTLHRFRNETQRLIERENSL
jgi:hypothetical protein